MGMLQLPHVHDIEGYIHIRSNGTPYASGNSIRKGRTDEAPGDGPREIVNRTAAGGRTLADHVISQDVAASIFFSMNRSRANGTSKEALSQNVSSV